MNAIRKKALVLDIDEAGYATLAWGDSFDLEPWLEEYSLDEAWRLGRLGGRS